MCKIAGIELTKVSKSFLVSNKIHPALKEISLLLPEQKISVLIGKSGCGKTTLLKLISGLEKPDSGTILFPEKTKIGVVFQEPRLMPWLTVKQNIAFSRPTFDDTELASLLRFVGLEQFSAAYPKQLSGGMQQRVALARALYFHPTALLMDEPFAALDYFTRLDMQTELIRLYQKQKLTIVFVTHNLDEALEIGHNIIVMGNQSILAMFDHSSCPYPRNPLDPAYIQKKKELQNILFLHHGPQS